MSDDIEIGVVTEKPKSGQWHCGPNQCWIVATHKPSMTQVRLYSGGLSQHSARSNAIAALEMLVDSLRYKECSMPELLA